MIAVPSARPEPGLTPVARPGNWTRLVAVAGLTLASVAIVVWLRRSQGDAPLQPGQGDSLSQLVWAAVYVLVVATLLGRLHDVLDTPLRAGAVWLLAALPLASAAWSDTPAISARQGAGVLLAAVLGFFLATSFTSRDLVAMLAWIALALALVSAVVALALPDRGIDHLNGDGDGWSGIFSTKNDLGRAMAFGTMLWLLRLVSGDGRRSTCLAAITACAGLVVLSESRTALVVVVALCLIVPALAFLRRNPALAGAALGIAVIAGGALAVWLDSHGSAVLYSPAADDALTGRTSIWIAAWDMARERFWLGYGQGAFWRGAEGPSALVWERTGDTPPHSHNGVLDLWLGLGLAGVLLFVAVAVLAVRRGLTLLRNANGVAALWPLAFVSFVALYNTTESTLLVPNTVFWALLVALLVQPAALAGDTRERWPS